VGLWRNLKTVFQLAAEVSDLRQRTEDLELEWLDKRDALDKLVRRLTTRATRSGGDSGFQPEEEAARAVSHAESTTDRIARKEALRAQFKAMKA